MDFLDLIQKVKAQGADTLAAPTFPFTPPGGTTPDPGNEEQNTITLQLDDTTVKVSDRFKVRVYINTTEENIKSFSVNISFNPNYLRVIDSDDTESGIQIDYIDTTFEDSTNEANNTTGIVNIRSEASSASGITRTVAEVEFLALKSGTSEISVIKANSNIVNSSGVDVLDETNAISLSIGSQSVIIPTDSNPVIIPDTAIQDYSGLLLGAFGGLLLIFSGIYVTRLGKQKHHKKQGINGDLD